MDCDSARTAVSANMDGEDPGVPASEVRAHLDGCAACRDWQERVHVLTRRARLGGPVLDHDLAPRVLAAIPAMGREHYRARRGVLRRVALAVVAIAQFAITLPLLLLGHDHDAGVHGAHELGSFALALAIAFAVGAVRPRLSAGLAWPCCIAALGLVGTAVADLVAGQALGADEAQHLVAVVGAILLFVQARAVSREPAGNEIAPAAMACQEHDPYSEEQVPDGGRHLGPVAMKERAA